MPARCYPTEGRNSAPERARTLHRSRSAASTNCEKDNSGILRPSFFASGSPGGTTILVSAPEQGLDGVNREETPPSPKLSVVVPFYNESENILRMHLAIVGAIEPLGQAFEMVFVDDGSKDDTLELAIGLARRDPRVRVVKFR